MSNTQTTTPRDRNRVLFDIQQARQRLAGAQRRGAPMACQSARRSLEKYEAELRELDAKEGQ